MREPALGTQALAAACGELVLPRGHWCRPAPCWNPPSSLFGGGRGNPLVFVPGESHGQRSLAGYSPKVSKVRND